MTSPDGRYRYASPPNWPCPPGFVPIEGWLPDPSWGPAPEGWVFWEPIQQPVPPPPTPAPVSTPVPTPLAPPTMSPVTSKAGGFGIGGVIFVAIALYFVFGRGPGGAFTSKDATIRVDAPAELCWSGNVGGATRDGCGSLEIPVHDELGIFSTVIQKQKEGDDLLTVTIVIDGNDKETNSTSASVGVVSVAHQP